MKIIKEKFKFEQKIGFYWGRIYFISDSKEWKTRILWAASREWVRRKVRLETWPDEEVERLVNKFVIKWKKVGNKAFRQDVHYDVNGTSPQEETTGKALLLDKDKV
jgi:hypothetical protein